MSSTSMQNQLIFISYARVDGEDSAHRLYGILTEQGIDVWLDRHNIAEGEDWDDAIDRGLESATAIVLVMTPGFTLSRQVKSEWNRAINRELPILPLLAIDCEVPRVLETYQYLDARHDFDGAARRVPERLQAMLEDHLAMLNQHLEAFRRMRESAQEPRRFDAKIEALESSIQSYEGRVANQAERIESGLKQHRQQQQAALTELETGTGQIAVAGRRPLDVTDYFKDRVNERDTISRLLAEGKTRMISIVGRGGMGKTALASKVLREIELGEWLSSTDDSVAIDGIVYLSTRTAGVSLERLFQDLARVLPHDESERIKTIWMNSQLPIETKIDALLKVLDDGIYIILMDNMEDLLDKNGQLIDPELQLFFNQALSTPSQARYMLTSRETLDLPIELNVLRQDVILRDGLPVEEAVQLLRDLDREHIYGLSNAPEDVLHKAVEMTHGVPRALEIIVGIMANDMFADLDEILGDFYSKDDVVTKLVEENYRRLDENARHVLEALAVYGRPVPQVAVDFLLAPFFPGIDVPGVLRRLANTHVINVDRKAKTISLHPIDREYAYNQLANEGSYSRQQMHQRAAAYYASQHFDPTRPYFVYSWDSLDAMEPHLLEFEHRILAEQYDEAMNALAEVQSSLNWVGYSTRCHDMLARVGDKLASPTTKMQYHFGMGENHIVSGRAEEAIAELEQGLELATSLDDSRYQGMILTRLSTSHLYTGNLEACIDFLTRALDQHRANGMYTWIKDGYADLQFAYLLVDKVEEAQQVIDDYKALLTEMPAEFGGGIDDIVLANMQVNMPLFHRDWQGVMQYADNAFALAIAGGDNIYPAVFRNTGGLAKSALRQVDAALQSFQGSYEFAQEIVHHVKIVRPLFNMAWLYYERGEIEEARSLLTEAKTFGRDVRERAAVDALDAAISARLAGQAAQEINALLDCAEAVGVSIDLQDGRLLARHARRLAEDVDQHDLAKRAVAILTLYDEKYAPLPV